jgi:ferrous iron transport protein A
MVMISLAEMEVGESGTVVEVLGGRGAHHRLEALGIRLGKTITKKSRGFFHGPITVQVGGTQIGLGHGLAHKVMVEVER